MCPWREALYGGALLSQVGEFSFVLAAIGLATGVIGEFSYQLTISVIVLTLVLSPPWVAMFRRLTRHSSLEVAASVPASS